MGIEASLPSSPLGSDLIDGLNVELQVPVRGPASIYKMERVIKEGV